ncbi:UDP-glycosyltransferase 75C1 [Euphorbia peplus]|nr:UDP-glycosyltransferase 75C1 [Euphorbia peplus]
MKVPHILLVIFPGQGHINPALQLAKRLLSTGIHVTFSTTIGAECTMPKTNVPPSLSFSPFSDGNDVSFKPIQNFKDYMSDLRHHGSQTLREIIKNSSSSSSPFTCVAYSLLLPWAATLAREFDIPSVLFWAQAATVFGIYYHYFNGFSDEIQKNVADSSFVFHFPGLLPLSSRDLPSFFIPSTATNEYAFALPLVQEHLHMLDQENNPKVLVNTFEELETEALNSVSKYKLIGIGPLIPNFDSNSSLSGGGDLFKSPNSKSYIEWLNGKAEGSVIYISFGSISEVSETQMEELRKALIESGRSFIWVIRENSSNSIKDRKTLEEKGMIVPWCNQLEVLSNPAIGCFFTHCGWNSTTESLSCGVPVVAFPQWTDQITNGKLVEDCWKSGVRVNPNEDGIVVADEIKRCLDIVMMGHGDGVKVRESAKKWKVLARNAYKEGGSSYINLQDFVNSMG